jgi:hypothetical protein
MPRYRLENAEAVVRQRTYRLSIPDRKDRDALQPGDMVKLIFMGHSEHGAAERAWVEVLSRKGRGYVGRVDNDLLFIDVGNGHVVFGPQHVIEILKPHELERLHAQVQANDTNVSTIH